MTDPMSAPPSRARRGLVAGVVTALVGMLSVVVLAAAPSASASTATAAKLAAANLHKSAGYCAVHKSSNSLGGNQFATSCDGHLGKGKGEYWCADFARWVWGKSGLNASGLTAAAASFNTYGTNHNSFRTTVAPGYAITFSPTRGGTSHHVGVVTAVSSTSITIANGDWAGSGSESSFSRTSSVVPITISKSQAKAGTYISSYRMYVSHIVAPAGAAGPAANPYTATHACGAGYSVIDHHALSGATVYLLYKSSGANCVVTLASTVSGKVSMSAHLQVKGKAVKTNSGSFTYYAGPVSASAAKKCVKWGGSYKSSAWTSAYSHCG